ncbi:MAG: GreA/GreB family elongation factor [Patescibacteria group bacterium]
MIGQPILPITRKNLEKELKAVSEKLKEMYGMGIPWQHDAGGFHSDLRNNLSREKRIAEILSESQIQLPPNNPSRAEYGVRVVVELGEGTETFLLVSPVDATFSRSKRERWLSYESPIGRAILGLGVGDSFEFTTPDGRKNVGRVIKIIPVDEAEVS